MKRFFLTAVLTLFAVPAFAESITVKVDGMVCAFCAAGVEQVFTEEKGVEKVHVDLDKSALELTTKDGALSDARIKELVDKAGFTATTIERK